MSVEQAVVSNATVRNWEKLRTSCLPNGRLTKRANKKLSRKFIFPREYLQNSDNFECVQELLSYIRENAIDTKIAMLSLCAGLLSRSGIKRKFNDNLCDYLVNFAIPTDEFDILGLIYQCLQTEGQKNVRGSYFTPPLVIQRLTQDILFERGAKILDPCCGTGSFLLSLYGVEPENIYGIDIDPIAVEIAKTNLSIKHKGRSFFPHIYCADFLSLNQMSDFERIISNPPWGAFVTDEDKKFFPEISSGESFSYFISQSLRMLKNGGELRFLLPESILNVRAHRDVREHILKNASVKKINTFDRCFSGVYTPVVGITLEKSEGNYTSNHHFVFTKTDNTDREIIEQIYGHPHDTLRESRWALGIVTGNNREKLHKVQKSGMEKIFTGKDVLRYELRNPASFVFYDRNNLQQVAPSELYRAKEKLVYKFISKNLVFAFDDSGSLCLNSANVLIPNVPNMSIKSVLAFLNSDVFQFLHKKKFGEIKILRGNLEQLPFPQISAEFDKQLTALANAAILGENSAHDAIQNMVYSVWGLNEQQKMHIKEVAHG